MASVVTELATEGVLSELLYTEDLVLMSVAIGGFVNKSIIII